jgi:hypothetical protein
MVSRETEWIEVIRIVKETKTTKTLKIVSVNKSLGIVEWLKVIARDYYASKREKSDHQTDS